MAPRWVKKRDGRIEPYDEGRVARAVLKAGRRFGGGDELERLAREVARSVTLYLSKLAERAPETAAVAQAVEGCLEETGHAPIAASARDWRDWRRRRQAEVRVREAPPPPAPGERPPLPIEVLSRSGARPWTKQRIVEALVQHAELERETAEDVARAVEERVFAAGLNQISTVLLRELIDAELFERGFSAQLGRLEVVGLSKPDLEALTLVGQGRAPLAAEDKVVRAALERYALDELVAGKGATAHRRGDLHLLGLGRPFRVASGAVSALEVCGQRSGATPAPQRPLDVVRRIVGAARLAATAHELAVGVVGLEDVLTGKEDAVQDALDVLLDALVAPCPDDVPPAPEVALVVAANDQGTPQRRTVELMAEALARRAPRGAGVRLVVRVLGPEQGLARLLATLALGAGTGAPIDLALGDGDGVASRGMLPLVTTVQVAVLNLAGLALAAGRGERRRLSSGIERAVEAALDACHRRRRHTFASLVRPSTPLFGQDGVGAPGDPTLGGVPLHHAGDAIGLVGLDAAMRWLTGESPVENPRVLDVAREVLDEVRACVDGAAARLGLGRVALEDVPEGDAGLRLAALDLDRFPAARELLGEAPGWDAGATLLPGAPDPLADVNVRLRLARRRNAVVVLPRPVLALARDPVMLASGLIELLTRPGTGRIDRVLAR